MPAEPPAAVSAPTQARPLWVKPAGATRRVWPSSTAQELASSGGMGGGGGVGGMRGTGLILPRPERPSNREAMEAEVASTTGRDWGI